MENVKRYKTEGSSFNLNKDRSGRRRTERTQQENIKLLQEKLLRDPKISATKNGFAISKSTFYRITKRDSQWYPYKMHVRKEIILNEVDLLKFNQDLLNRVVAKMRRKMQVCLQRNGGHIEGNGN